MLQSRPKKTMKDRNNRIKLISLKLPNTKTSIHVCKRTLYKHKQRFNSIMCFKRKKPT